MCGALRRRGAKALPDQRSWTWLKIKPSLTRSQSVRLSHKERFFNIDLLTTRR
jgi:hypothetical protein